MDMPMNNWTAALIFLTLYVAPSAAFVYRRRYGRYAKQIRAWRRRLAATPDQPFHLRQLTPAERNRLIGRGGLTSDEWFRAVAADFVAGRRDNGVKIPVAQRELRMLDRPPPRVLNPRDAGPGLQREDPESDD